jgi:hypothetical protein
MKKLILISLAMIGVACVSDESKYIQKTESKICTRYLAPENFERINYEANSYSYYCQNLTLKPYGEKVHYFSGEEKTKSNVYSSVLDQKISAKDLQQCADACMRIRGEYLFSVKEYSQIHFNFVSDGKPRYFTEYAGQKRDYQTFIKYMDYVFGFANTSSLYQELKTITPKEAKAGDVIIQKGNPYGHAVIILDVVKNKEGEKRFLLAQSYMPAQETQILKNPNSSDGSPWYEISENEKIQTPEWIFENYKIGRFL